VFNASRWRFTPNLQNIFFYNFSWSHKKSKTKNVLFDFWKIGTKHPGRFYLSLRRFLSNHNSIAMISAQAVTHPNTDHARHCLTSLMNADDALIDVGPPRINNKLKKRNGQGILG
jgi:L-ascorbate metabolism protein UlaG (beta-lactamase superfamily)